MMFDFFSNARRGSSRSFRRVRDTLAVASTLLAVGCFQATAQAEQKKSVGILLDNTGSMRLQLEDQQKIANAVIEKAGAGSPVSLFGFAGGPPPPVPGRSASFAAGVQCSTDRQTLNAQIAGISTVGGQTVIIDAIKSAVQIMNNPGAPECQALGTRILVVVTDGEDRASETSTEQLIEFVKARKVTLYVIGLLRSMSSENGFISKSPAAKSKEFLTKLAKDTGGRVLFSKHRTDAEKIVTELFSESYVFPK